MNVQSHLFVLAYLPLVIVLWWLSNRRWGNRAARILLLTAGALFCGWASPPALLVLLAEGMVSYLLGRRMVGREAAHKKVLLAVGVGLLLTVLAFFKYTGFALSLTPLEGLLPTPPGWLAPLGLSFVTFQQIFFLRDCYDGAAGSDVSPLDYATCLTYFPTATSGPITRMGELAPQLRNPAVFSWENMASGLWCFSLGLFKKVLLAELFAGGADWGFPLAGTLTPCDAVLVSLCYTLQIYFDFSGYCDIVWGIARMMGVEMPVNFDSPYKAASIADFWKRWHITLSRFFTNCVYIPLGGNREGMATTCRNIMVIFLLSGIWHGAGLGFLVWGALHGGAMVLERLGRGKVRVPKILGWLLTFLFVNAAWVFFRAETLNQALSLLRDMTRGSWELPSAEFAAALLLPEFEALATFANLVWAGAKDIFYYWMPMLSLPLGMALLALPNPLRQAQNFQLRGWKVLVIVIALVWSVVSLSGVDVFIYENF